MPSTWAVNTPKGQVRIVDLPLDVFAELEESTGRQWGDILIAPAMTAKSAQAVYLAACASNGSEPEPLTPTRLIEPTPIFEFVEDDAVVVWSSDTALPESEGAQVTTGSSGAPEPSDGHLL